MQVGNVSPTKNRANPNQGRVYLADGIAPTLSVMGGGGREPHIIEVTHIPDEPLCLNPKGGRGGIEGLQPSVQDRVYSTDALSFAMTTSYMPKILEIEIENE